MFHHVKATALALAVLSQAVSVAAFADTADKIWTGGPILTMNDAAMRAEAVAVKDGKILAVGSKDDVLKTKGEKTKSSTSAAGHSFPASSMRTVTSLWAAFRRCPPTC